VTDLPDLSKLFESLEEHIDILLSIRELKSKGCSDREICSTLGIGATRLARYKDLLRAYESRGLASNEQGGISLAEFQNYKRLELDDQIQSTIRQLNTLLSRIDEEHQFNKAELTNLLGSIGKTDDRTEPAFVQDAARKLRMARYPVEDVVNVEKTILSAVSLRAKIWGLNQETGMREVAGSNSKLGAKRLTLIQVNEAPARGIPSVREPKEASLEKLNKIADYLSNKIIGDGNGMQLQEEDDGE